MENAESIRMENLPNLKFHFPLNTWKSCLKSTPPIIPNFMWISKRTLGLLCMCVYNIMPVIVVACRSISWTLKINGDELDSPGPCFLSCIPLGYYVLLPISPSTWDLSHFCPNHPSANPLEEKKLCDLI